MSGISKVLGLATAAAGLLLVNDNRKFSSAQATIEEHHMVEEDHYQHMFHSAADYSNRGTLMRLKHWVFNPANTHFIRRPLVHVYNFVEMLRQNFIPLAITFSGLAFGFNWNLAKMAQGIGKGLVTLFGKNSFVRRFAGGFFSALGTFFKPVTQAIMKLPYKMPKGPTLLATAALGAMGLFYMHEFKREITGENRDKAINFLSPPHGH